jgi:hypothetical protein
MAILAASVGGVDFECTIPGGRVLQSVVFHAFAPVDKSPKGYRTNAVQWVLSDGSISAPFNKDFESIKDELPAQLLLTWRNRSDALESLAITAFDAGSGTAKYKLVTQPKGALAKFGPTVLEGSCITHYAAESSPELRKTDSLQ